MIVDVIDHLHNFNAKVLMISGAAGVPQDSVK